MKKIYLLIAILNFLFFISAFAQNPLVKQWDKRYGGTFADQVWSFQQTKDGGYILGGNSDSGIGGDKTQPVYGAHGDYDYWIVKTDSQGNYQWDKDFGGTSLDFLFSLQQTTDGGYILGGFSSSGIGGSKTSASVGAQDYWIIKIDSLGNEQWEKDFGGTLGDLLYSLQQTKDGGYILGGYSRSGNSGDKTKANWDASNATADYWVVKTDSLGNKQWDKTFGGTLNDELLSVQQTKDGGYILGGYSSSGISGDKTQAVVDSSDYWIVKVDSLGNKQWDKDFGGTGIDELDWVTQTADGGYILGGYSNSPLSGDKTQASYGLADFWIVKTDSLGNKQWDKIYGGSLYEEEVGTLSQTTDGGYLFAGTSYSPISGNKTEANLGQEQTWVVKTDGLGNKQWDKTVFTGGHDEMGLAIQTKDGCYAFANYTGAGIGGYKTQTSRGSVDFWIVKFCDSTAQALPVSNFTASQKVFCEAGGCINFYDSSSGSPTSWKWLFPGANPNISNVQNPTGICYNNAGTYSVTLIVTNATGSDTLTVSPMIIVSSGATSPVVSLSSDTLFSSHSTTYQWYLNGFPVAGATDSFYVCSQSGTYSVRITDSLGCSALSNGVYNSCITGIEFMADDLRFTVYPNPASDKLNIVNNSGKKITLQIHNMLGEMILQSEINTHLEADISTTFPKGIYLISIKTDDKILYKKLVKQ